MAARKQTGYRAVVLILMSCVSLWAQTKGHRNDDGAFFLQQAYQNAAWLARLGELASQHAASQYVREYGRMTAADYEQHLTQIKELAARKGVALEKDYDPSMLATIQHFSGQSGAEFDRNYISLMIDENERQILLYRKEASQGRESEAASLAFSNIKRLEGDAAFSKMVLNNLPKPVLK